jgi:hypothetical protein
MNTPKRPEDRTDDTVRLPRPDPPTDRKVLANKLRSLASDVERGEANDAAIALLLALVVGR